MFLNQCNFWQFSQGENVVTQSKKSNDILLNKENHNLEEGLINFSDVSSSKLEKITNPQSLLEDVSINSRINNANRPFLCFIIWIWVFFCKHSYSQDSSGSASLSRYAFNFSYFESNFSLLLPTASQTHQPGNYCKGLTQRAHSAHSYHSVVFLQFAVTILKMLLKMFYLSITVLTKRYKLSKL